MSQDKHPLSKGANEKSMLGRQEQEARLDHREWIGGRAYTLLCHYWREEEPEMLASAIAKDWADVLEGIPQQFIQKACLRYLRNEPRKKPTPGAIYELAKAAMPKPHNVYSRPPEPEREPPCNPARAQEILKNAGFNPKRFPK